MDCICYDWKHEFACGARVEQVRSKYREYSFVDIRIEEISMRGEGRGWAYRHGGGARLNGRNNKGERGALLAK